MIVLRRHQLVHLKAEAWEPIIANAEAGAAQRGLQHWAENDLPLVVARQDTVAPALTLKLGLPLPQAWGRLRLSLHLSLRLSLQLLPTQIDRVAAFPAARDVAPLLLPPAQAAWHELCDGLAALGLTAQVYGSYGWQWLTGQHYLRASSDLDMLVAVQDATAADAAVACLSTWGCGALQLDGEVVFDDGSAVAWREWRAWRSGQVQQLLVKYTNGVCLEVGARWLAPQPDVIAS